MECIEHFLLRVCDCPELEKPFLSFSLWFTARYPASYAAFLLHTCIYFNRRALNYVVQIYEIVKFA